MRILIVEDEINAYEYLSKTLLKIDDQIVIDSHLDSVQSVLSFMSDGKGQEIDLIFLDIQLADGLSFEIFNHIDISTPIIFTTAYDQYALEAFKVHSVDYLLKPIHEDDLRSSLSKFKTHFVHGEAPSLKEVAQLMQKQSGRKKSRCLVKRGGHFEYVDVSEIAFINSEDSLTFLHSSDSRRHIYSKTIETMMDELDHEDFFQISRSNVVNAKYIKEIHPYLNQRLKITLKKDLASNHDLIVSRGRVAEFKKWIDN